MEFEIRDNKKYVVKLIVDNIIYKKEAGNFVLPLTVKRYIWEPQIKNILFSIDPILFMLINCSLHCLSKNC